MGVVNFTPTTAVVNTVLPSASWNSDVRDAWNNIQSAWTAYTPALTAATTNPTLGTGSVTNGWYNQVGKTILAHGRIGFGTSGVVVGGGRYTISLPVTALTTAGLTMGIGILQDASGPTTFALMLRLASPTTFYMYLDNQTAATLGCSSAAPVAPAASDTYDFLLIYQAA